ncbi:hypothetical protein CI102_1767 [Trichoderma harzianum]|uniref:Uncharacterized protein n=1 Tax=Trichoderma harzianum CBS 226.95 TaxID=983964 RepID=A0A2T3ZWX2_TRIHA|nr:hypothetical protein M431DRAFT_277009 [Trichoderma harzianum CBS 226.95]PKK53752.1 hypothetical protein CI102_1767 [Trichoderma harzianum]PTB49278.1 hypothetical protein M431DRAFT_277009 [Trichoderma harzianum CBS 226.95]
MQSLGMSDFIFYQGKKEEKREKGQRQRGIEPRSRGGRAGFSSLGQLVLDLEVPLDTALMVAWIAGISRPQPPCNIEHRGSKTKQTDAITKGKKENVKMTFGSSKSWLKHQKKNLYAQRSILVFSVDPTARPGFPWVFLCGYQQLERATGGVYASAIQGCGPCLRVPDLAVAFVVMSRATWEVPSQVTSRCIADQAITKWAARC